MAIPTQSPRSSSPQAVSHRVCARALWQWTCTLKGCTTNSPLVPSRALCPVSRRGLTIMEIVVSMAILLTGIVAIFSFFPRNLSQNQRIADKSVAVYLAQMKAEEIRRDNSGETTLIEEIQAMRVPSTPITFPFEPHFAYSFSGISLLDPDGPPGIARIIIRYSSNFRFEQEILYELAFDK